MIWTTEKLNTAGHPTTRVQTAGDAENENASKCSGEKNDAQNGK